MADNNFDSTVASLFKGMDAFISANYITYTLRKYIYVQTAWFYILLDCCRHDNYTVYNGQCILVRVHNNYVACCRI